MKTHYQPAADWPWKERSYCGRDLRGSLKHSVTMPRQITHSKHETTCKACRKDLGMPA